jgi:aminoglycoside phosphotransferase (APT) family kinase protein
VIDTDDVVPAGPLARHLDERLGGDPTPVSVTKIGQGRSNLTFRVTRGDQGYVLRRPPLGDIPETAHDMGREHRLLTALAAAEVRTPAPVLLCDDAAVIGAPFVLMEQVDGIVIRETTPAAYDADDRRLVGLELVDALAELHTVDVEAVGLADLGRPGYTARQVTRWTRQWGQMRTREIADLDVVRAWLEDHVPATHPPAVVHGDYKLDNVVFSAAGPARLRAILDWEMATVGDPLADLGYLLIFWPGPDEPSLAGFPLPSQEGGYPSRAEIVARYEARTGFDVAGIEVYQVLALWKLAILTEGLYKRYLDGKSDSEWPKVLEHAVPAMAAMARELAGA